jgi:hypothetical protein
MNKMKQNYTKNYTKKYTKKYTKNKNKNKKKVWNCNYCNYNTLHKGTYERHLASKKHKSEILNKTHPFICEKCNMGFNSRTTLWRHTKKCDAQISFGNKETYISKLTEELEKKAQENKELMQLLNKVVEQNTEMVPRIGNNNNTNNNISINVILNEKCKDAMNLTDFVDKVNVSLEDLMYTKNNGYVKGISNILVNQLKDMSVEDRPIHCSDQNMLQFYVKDENKWEKDDKNDKVNNSINKIQKKQIRKIKEWTDKYPNFLDDKELYIEYQKMIKTTMCINFNEIINIKKSISDIVDIKEIV